LEMLIRESYQIMPLTHGFDGDDGDSGADDDLPPEGNE
jgi:hypothetical protein